MFQTFKLLFKGQRYLLKIYKINFFQFFKFANPKLYNVDKMHSRIFLAENNKLVHSKMLIRPSSDMFNLRIRVRSRKNREYLQNSSSNPPGKLCNRIFGSFLRRKQLTNLLVRADHPKVPLPPLKLPLCDRERVCVERN